MSRPIHPRIRVLLQCLMGIGIVAVTFISVLWLGIPTKTKGNIQAGVTFSQTYATELHLDWRDVLTAALDDLGIRHFRIPAYWSIVEPARGVYDWSSIDHQLNEIAKRDGSVMLAVGMKLPRWPECWMPDWARILSTDEEHRARLEYLVQAVNRYKTHPALTSWQVENEASFEFGICPPPDPAFHSREIALVRYLDPSHPVMTTDSGELSTWTEVGSQVDALGISVYRVVRHASGMVWRYTFIPPYWYARHAWLVSPWVTRVYVSEFQMEPWVKSTVLQTPLAEQFETFDVSQMRANFDYAERMQFSDISFWGVEWWYWMKKQQYDPTFWETAKTFFLKHTTH